MKVEEFIRLERMFKRLSRFADVRQEGCVQNKKHKFPFWTINFSNEDRRQPGLLFVAGVHGVERIGTRVLNAFIKSLYELCLWDDSTLELVKNLNLTFFPIVNPLGMHNGSRSNAEGIDLMRNAPVDGNGISKYKLWAGHRISPKLPWYRGVEGDEMAYEARILKNVVERTFANRQFCLSVDIHSGYGHKNYLWFPYAHQHQPIKHINECMELKQLFENTYPSQNYVIEPQSLHYKTHGDLWDYFYNLHTKKYESSVYVPMTLELGSWDWIKKNPKQLFYFKGLFNPIIPKRRKRILREHHVLLDFLIRATISWRRWASHQSEETALAVNEKWYPNQTLPNSFS